MSAITIQLYQVGDLLEKFDENGERRVYRVIEVPKATECRVRSIAVWRNDNWKLASREAYFTLTDLADCHSFTQPLDEEKLMTAYIRDHHLKNESFQTWHLFYIGDLPDDITPQTTAIKYISQVDLMVLRNIQGHTNNVALLKVIQYYQKDEGNFVHIFARVPNQNGTKMKWIPFSKAQSNPNYPYQYIKKVYLRDSGIKVDFSGNIHYNTI